MWMGVSVLREGRRIFDMLLAIKLKLSKTKDGHQYTFKYIPMLYLLICIIFSSLQTYNTFEQYFNYEYIVRVSSDVHLQFPSFKLTEGSSIELQKLHNEFNATNQEGRKLFIEEYFSRIFRMDCQLILSKNQRISCDQYYHSDVYYKWIAGFDANITINRLTLMEVGGRNESNNQTNNLLHLSIEDKPRIELNIFSSINAISPSQINFIQGSIGETLTINIIKSMQSDVAFTQQSIELLPSPYSTDCLNYPTDAYSSDQACYQECITRLELNRFGCLNEGFLTLDALISQWMHQFKQQPLCNSPQNKTIADECNLECKPNCLLNNFHIYANFALKKNLNVNESRFYLFPTERPFIKYIYTPKMEIDQLVYDLGGIIGLWFGLSAYSILLKSLALSREINGENICSIFSCWYKLLSYLGPHGINSKRKRMARRRKHVLNLQSSRSNKFINY